MVAIDSYSYSEERGVSKVNPKSVLKRYESGQHYMEVFSQLLKLEEEYQKRLDGPLRAENNVSVRWHVQPSGRVVAYFHLKHYDIIWKLMLGDKLKLSHPGGPTKSWAVVGCVVDEGPPNCGGDVSFRISTDISKNSIPLECTSNFSVRYIWNSPAHNRMKLALKHFRDNSSTKSNHIYNQTLGLDTRDLLFERRDYQLHPVRTLPPLRRSQVSVVKEAIKRPLALIQGPPGTGKTVVALTILYYLVKQNKVPVLVCAPSNVAVDQLTQKIHKIGLKVVRVFAESKKSFDSPVAFLGLNNRVKELNPELDRLREEFDTISIEEEERLLAAKKESELEILDEAEVVCCTCIAAGDARLAGMKFGAVIIDECTQATEPECLIPLMFGSEQLILVGDLFGLGPVIKSGSALRLGLNQSLFQRLVNLELRTFSLTVQYRMHPALSWFPSNFYYKGNLEDGVGAVERMLPAPVFLWPVLNKPIVFYAVRDPEERISLRYEYINRAEALIIEQVTTHLLERGIEPDQIGIITPYESQRNYIAQCIGNTDKTIVVGKVDAFQGREKDIIIISCVRSSEDQGVGSLSYANRLNLVLTRARYGLIIVGNPEVLSKQLEWKNLMDYLKKEKVVVENLTL